MSAPDSTSPPPRSAPDVDRLLRCGDLVVQGRMPWSSNATFLVAVHEPGTVPAPLDAFEDDGDEPDLPPPLLQAVYKPHRGERPLWDFPDGLWQREVAAHRLSHALGWDVVPETIPRDGPFGIGSLQRFVDADFSQHYFTLLEDPATHDQLRRMCAFDLVANSTDRKGGHVLVDTDRHIWGIDNGLSFHEEFKLRTVIWDFAEEPVPAALADDLIAFADSGIPDDLAELLDDDECAAILRRARTLVTDGRFPTDPTGRRYPWPLV